MTSETVAPADASEIIRRAAKLIEEHGWLANHGGTATQMGEPGLTITAAVCWAVHGQSCAGRDLQDVEASQVAEILDSLDIYLGCPVATWERRHADDTPSHVSSELRSVAWILGTPTDEM